MLTVGQVYIARSKEGPLKCGREERRRHDRNSQIVHSMVAETKRGKMDKAKKETLMVDIGSQINDSDVVTSSMKKEVKDLKHILMDSNLLKELEELLTKECALELVRNKQRK